jgi:hypothetical protein
VEAARSRASEEAVEDAFLLRLDALEAELGAWLAAGVDDAIVNGDVSGSHQDADTTATSDVRKAWNGLRKLCPAATKTDGGNVALTAAMLRTNRKKLGRAAPSPPSSSTSSPRSAPSRSPPTRRSSPQSGTARRRSRSPTRSAGSTTSRSSSATTSART